MSLPNEQIREKLDQCRRRYVEEVFASLDQIQDAGERLELAQNAVLVAFARDREQMAMVAPFSPDSLAGSYFRIEHEDGLIEEGLVVGQPHTTPVTAIYLCEFFGMEGTLGYQRAVDLEQMVVQKWTFYDSDAWLAMNSQPATRRPSSTKNAAKKEHQQ